MKCKHGVEGGYAACADCFRDKAFAPERCCDWDRLLHGELEPVDGAVIETCERNHTGVEPAVWKRDTDIGELRLAVAGHSDEIAGHREELARLNSRSFAANRRLDGLDGVWRTIVALQERVRALEENGVAARYGLRSPKDAPEGPIASPGGQESQPAPFGPVLTTPDGTQYFGKLAPTPNVPLTPLGDGWSGVEFGPRLKHINPDGVAVDDIKRGDVVAYQNIVQHGEATVPDRRVPRPATVQEQRDELRRPK